MLRIRDTEVTADVCHNQEQLDDLMKSPVSQRKEEESDEEEPSIITTELQTSTSKEETDGNTE